MKQFHALKVAAKQLETRDSVRIALDVPEDLRDEYTFLPGQHVPVQIEIDGKKIRRTYSICSEQDCWPLEIGVRLQPGGQFSGYAAEQLQVGDSLEVMPPNGQFHVRAAKKTGKHYLAFAAGSGITPILSIATSVLRDESDSRFALFYGNRKQNSTMFIDDLYALKNRYADRLQLHFVFSQEEQEFEISGGRLDADKVRELYRHFCNGAKPDEAFVCGPDTMIDTVTATLQELGMAESAIHAERFGAPRKSGRPSIPVEQAGGMANVTVIMDGHRKSFEMQKAGTNIVDAAAEQGVELPYSCKGGVCATCRTHVQKGKIDMATNFGLEPWEVEQGFVLACQSTPVSDDVTLNYDKT
ncbi:MAG: 2Fe-2S iron-sulfur cluster binding domain-containing protein [Gammaproteobacteria bacterium]|nr:2Fe-2S iron-sulfur cluster binding domain-containing protein [Gammaproteobacteria bacterium]